MHPTPKTSSNETTPNERKEILQFFAELIKIKKVPGKKQVMHYMNEKKRKLEWKAVKNIVYSRIQCLKSCYSSRVAYRWGCSS
jgi:hypothetical protein